MNRSMIVCCVVIFGLSAARADEPEKPADDLSKGTHGAHVSDETKKKAAEQMMADMMPGPQHEELSRRVGTWRQVTKYFTEPGAPPLTIEGEGVCTMVLGGRFLKCESKGQFMGQPFESLSMMGYDRRTETYTLVAFDTMGTYYVTGEGKKDEKTGTLKLPGTTHDPKIGSTERYFFIFRDMSPDSYVSEVWFLTPDDKEFKVVETTCTRVK